MKKISYVGVVSAEEGRMYIVKVTKPWEYSGELELLLAQKFKLSGIEYVVLKLNRKTGLPFGIKKMTI